MTSRSRCRVGAADSCGSKKPTVRWGCTLAPPGESHWMIRAWQRCGLTTGYFDHLTDHDDHDVTYVTGCLRVCLEYWYYRPTYTIREAIKRALQSWHKSASSTARKEKLKSKKGICSEVSANVWAYPFFYYDHVQLRLNGLTNRAGLLHVWRRAILCIQWGHIVVKDINFGI